MVQIYSLYDFIFFPLYIVVLIIFLFAYEKSSNWNSKQKKYLYYAFAFRVFFCVLYFLFLQFYYMGYGDSTGYWQSIGALRETDWFLKFDFLINPNAKVKYGSALFYSFGDYNGFIMGNPSNAAVCKIGYFLSYLCGNSYLTLSLFYSFFALIGCWRLYLLFIRYYPSLEKEFAVSLLFLPSVCFWSSGLLKDPLTLGAIGLFVVSTHQLLIDKRKIFSSLFMIFICGAIVLIIKPYILLAIIPGLAIWIFTKYNFSALNKQMRSLITIVFIVIACGIIILLLRYFTSTDYAKQLQTDNLSEKITEMRNVYAVNEEAKGNSYFELGTNNSVLAFLLGIVASLFRPFLWETRSFSMFFSGVEAFVFLLLTLHLFFKIGIFKMFKSVFSNSETTFFFLFTIVFAGAVGSSTPNFGTLVRYKIPCLPFYMMMLFILMYRNKVPYPGWLNKLLGKKPARKYSITPRSISHA